MTANEPLAAIRACSEGARSKDCFRGAKRMFADPESAGFHPFLGDSVA